MLVLGVTKIEFKCWLRGVLPFIVIADLWELLWMSELLLCGWSFFLCRPPTSRNISSVWISAGSQWYQELIWKRSMLYIHDKFKVIFYFKMVKFRVTWCVTSRLTDALTFLSQAMTLWQMMRVIMTSTPWLVFSNFTFVVWKTLSSPKRDSTICWPVSVRTCISPPFTLITPLWCGCTSCQWSSLNLCSTKMSQKFLDSFWWFCFILELLLHALGKISQ